MLEDEIPVVGDAESRSIWHRDGAVLVDGVYLIVIATGIHGRDEIRHTGSEQGKLIEMRVSDCGHADAVRRTARVDLHIDPERLGHVRDLHRARDAHVVFRIEVNVVATSADQEPSLLLWSADVLGD